MDTALPDAGGENHRWFEGCLAYGIALETTTEVIVAERLLDTGHLETLITEHALLPRLPTGLSTSFVLRICELTRAVAAEAERRAALQMAYSMLAQLDRLPRAETPLEYGRVLALRARIARKADAPAIADELYRRVDAIARQTSSDELKSRALVGRGVLAHARGNYPSARRLYTRAARKATASGDPALVRHAYHGLMVVSAKYGKFGLAFTAGWIAFQGAAGDPQIEAEMLLNLAQLALDVGEPQPALHAFAAALAREPAPWQYLPALGGAARAAAALGRGELVRECARRVERFDADTVGFAYSRASALLDVSLAFGCISLWLESGKFARRVHALASTHNFHELVLESEQLIARAAQLSSTATRPSKEQARNDKPPVIDAAGYVILDRLTSLGHPDSVLAHAHE